MTIEQKKNRIKIFADGLNNKRINTQLFFSKIEGDHVILDCSNGYGLDYKKISIDDFYSLFIQGDLLLKQQDEKLKKFLESNKFDMEQICIKHSGHFNSWELMFLSTIIDKTHDAVVNRYFRQPDID